MEVFVLPGLALLLLILIAWGWRAGRRTPSEDPSDTSPAGPAERSEARR